MEYVKITLKVLYYLLLAITLVFSLYFSLVGLYGLLKKNKETLKEIKKNNRFAILIAARNEENVIGALIDSLKKIDYPKDYYDVYVIPNNCTDKTSEISKEHGSKVLECTVKTKVKADVLRFAFRKLEDKDYDAYIIFDADNIVDKNYLKEMNTVLNNGHNIAYGLREAKNSNDSWVSGSYAIYYIFMNLFINYSRYNMGVSCLVTGTGFMVSKKIIDKYGFDTKTLTEDLEYSGFCALNKERVYFAKNAITYDELPVKFMASVKQRKRWTAGTIECMKLYSHKLLKDFLKNGNIASLDICLLYITPYIQVFSFLNILFIPLFRLLKIDLFGFDIHMLITGLISSIASYVLTVAFSIIIVMMLKKKVLPLLKGILFFPLFIFSWVPINIYCLIKKQDSWEEIKHSKKVTIDDLVKEQ